MSSEQGATILVAEDDPDALSVVAFGLHRAGYAVLCAADGAEALQLAREHRPDVAIVDVMMPKVNGYEVTRLLRADAATAAIPVILLTARAGERDVAQGFEVGASEYLRKPFSPRRLEEAIQTLLARRRVEA